jgi:hypothetical protein
VEQSAVNRILVIISLAIASPTALGYLGPGVGGGAIATVLGFFGAILLGLFGILYYPIKRALKNRQARKHQKKAQRK